MAIKNKYFLGRGEVYAKVFGTDTYLPIFNCSVAKITQSEQEFVLKSYEDINGGNADRVVIPDKVGLELTAHSFNKENLAFFLRANVTEFSESTVTDVDAVANIGRLVRVGKAGYKNLVVKSGVDVLVAGVDYEAKRGGFIPLDGGALTEGDPIKFSATLNAVSAIAALTSPQSPMTIFISGMNGSDGKQVTVDAWKASFGLVDSIDFIGSDFASITLKAELLKDETKQGLSQFYDINEEV